MSAVYKGSAGRQRGIAAVEFAIVLPFLVLMLIMPLYLGRVFWHYTAIQHAAQDAARYLSTIPAADMSNPARAPAAVAVANAILTMELAELAPGDFAYGVAITCDGAACLGFFRPDTVRVNVSLLMQDVVFAGLNPTVIPLVADVSYPYMGR
ncbi:pilus assembly protein [Oxalobacteraceae bacterium OTU3CAMAD1]|nr:pilus assembly protein [Oxalobacteraceae bacterium OTU3CAMAD1]